MNEHGYCKPETSLKSEKAEHSYCGKTEENVQQELCCGEANIQVYPNETLVLSDSSESALLRLKCTTKEEFLTWLDQYQNMNNLMYRLQVTRVRKGEKVLYKASYRCHRNTYPKSYRRRTKNASKKHTACESKVCVTIKAPAKRRKRSSLDVYRKDYPTIVTIKKRHNHEISGIEASRYRDPSGDVRRTFLDMFRSGVTPRHALEMHRLHLMKVYGEEFENKTADRSICPDMKWVYNYYYSVKRKNLLTVEGSSKINFGMSDGEGVTTNSSEAIKVEEDSATMATESQLEEIYTILKEGLCADPRLFIPVISDVYALIIEARGWTTENADDSFED